jgi:hypothetical protein
MCCASFKIQGKQNAQPHYGPGVYSASNRNEYQKQKKNISGM